jgi:hypothetical protein
MKVFHLIMKYRSLHLIMNESLIVKSGRYLFMLQEFSPDEAEDKMFNWPRTV